MPVPFERSALLDDLSPRIVGSTTVVASPTDATETIIGSVQLVGDLSYATGVFLIAQCSLTVGTNGVSVQLKWRRTSVGGTTVTTGGVSTSVAANVVYRELIGLDTSPGTDQIYKLTLTVGSASAASTVSQLGILAIAV